MSTLRIAYDIWRAGRGSQQAIADRQRRRLNEIVAHARANSAFYAGKYTGVPAEIGAVTELPPVTKPELMAHFPEVVTDPQVTRTAVEAFVADKAKIGHLFQDRYLVCTTSGTTGVPATFLYDQHMLDVLAALNLARTVPAWLTWGDLGRMMKQGARTAAVWATEGHFLGIGMAKRQLLQRPSRASRLRVFSVLTPLRELVAELNAFQPAMLNGYATAISLLADEQVAGRLDIHPTLVLTSSETLPAGERDRIAEVFGALVRDNYGASEFVALGYDCGHGWLHLNADWVIVEPVDGAGNPVPPGQLSQKVYLTNLANRVMPILRYEMGDRIVVKPQPCACGSPLPAIRVEGRTDDVLRFRTAAGDVVPVLPLALWSVLKETPGVLRFQAIQSGPQTLTVRLESQEGGDREEIWRALRSRARDYLRIQGLEDVVVTLSEELPRRDPKSGKFRQVWADLGLP